MNALETFIAKKAVIDAQIKRLTALSADHFNCHPDQINWGHVGSLSHIADELKEIIDFADV